MGFFDRLRGKKTKNDVSIPKKSYDTPEIRELYNNSDNFWLDPENFRDHLNWGILSMDDEERLVDIILEHEDIHRRGLAFYRLRQIYKNEIPDLEEYVFQLSDHIGLSVDDLGELISEMNNYMWAKKVFFKQVPK